MADPSSPQVPGGRNPGAGSPNPYGQAPQQWPYGTPPAPGQAGAPQQQGQQGHSGQQPYPNQQPYPQQQPYPGQQQYPPQQPYPGQQPPAGHQMPAGPGYQGQQVPPQGPPLGHPYILSHTGGPGGGRSRKGRVILLVCVVLALIAGGALWVTAPWKKESAGDGQKLAAAHEFQFGADRTALWSVPGKRTSAQDDKLIHYVGTWVTDKYAVAGDSASMTAFDLRTGKPGMKFAPPNPGAVPCAMSKEITKDGLAAALYRSKGGAYSIDPCTVLTIVDTHTGRVVFKDDIHPGADGADESNTASVALDTEHGRVYAVTDDRAVAYDLASHKRLWLTGGKRACRMTGLATPGGVVVEQGCASDLTMKISSLDLESGSSDKGWSHLLPNGYDDEVQVLSTKPAAVFVQPLTDEKAPTSVIAFDDKGKPSTTVKSTSDADLPKVSEYTTVPTYFFSDDTMVAAIAPPRGNGRGKTAFTAWDLSDGKVRWRTEVGGDNVAGGQITDLTGDTVTGVQMATFDDDAVLIHLDLGTGKETKGGSFAGKDLNLRGYQVMLTHGNLVLLAPANASVDVPTMAVYGPKS